MSCNASVVLCDPSGNEVLAYLASDGPRYLSLPTLTPYTGDIASLSSCKADDRDCFHIAGTARNSTEGWFWIANDNHAPKGIDVDDISINVNDDLRIAFSQTASAIGSLIVGPDEVLAKRNYTMGASVSVSSANIRFGDELGNQIPADQVTSSGNIWVLGLMWV